jgi:hypothetical protein
LVLGEEVEPEVYGAVLQGALAEEEGDGRRAEQAYADALAWGGEDALVLARWAALRCRRDPKDSQARRLLRRARWADPESASFLVALGECAEVRGQTKDAQAAYAHALLQDPGDAEVERRWARTAGARSQGEAGRRLQAFCLANPYSVDGWDALGAWARAHGETTVLVRSLAAVARLDSRRRGRSAAVAAALAKEGHGQASRWLAAQLVDASKEGPRDWSAEATPAVKALVARLAVDEALMRQDGLAAEKVALRMFVSQEELAARAQLLRCDVWANQWARQRLAAEPSSISARLVLASLADGEQQGRSLAEALETLPARPAVPFVVRLVVERALRRMLPGNDGALVLEALAVLPVEAPIEGDPLVLEARRQPVDGPKPRKATSDGAQRGLSSRPSSP